MLSEGPDCGFSSIENIGKLKIGKSVLFGFQKLLFREFPGKFNNLLRQVGSLCGHAISIVLKKLQDSTV
jgi:hypothetical protein